MQQGIVLGGDEDVVVGEIHVGRVVQADILLDAKRSEVLPRDKRLLVEFADRRELVHAL